MVRFVRNLWAHCITAVPASGGLLGLAGAYLSIAQTNAFGEDMTGGKGFIAMTSTAKNGTVSKVKPVLTPGSIVTTSKNEVDFLVTENNIVRLKGRTASERAKMIISLAAPEFRDELLFEAKKMNLIV